MTELCFLVLSLFLQPLDYEITKSVDLKIQAENAVALEGIKANWLTIPVVVKVNNVDEGPEFKARNMRLVVKENTPNGTVIGSFVAKDPETDSAGGIK